MFHHTSYTITYPIYVLLVSFYSVSLCDLAVVDLQAFVARIPLYDLGHKKFKGNPYMCN